MNPFKDPAKEEILQALESLYMQAKAGMISDLVYVVTREDADMDDDGEPERGVFWPGNTLQDAVVSLTSAQVALAGAVQASVFSAQQEEPIQNEFLS
jgi:hypothetical protein